jgi:DNA-binding NarL/FixJ family response regulator
VKVFLRNFLQRLLQRLDLPAAPPADPAPPIDPGLWRALHDLAEQEQRLPEELAGEAFSLGLAHLQSGAEALRLWALLTPREQDVTALVCLGYTGRQIAARLGISHQTVKAHSANALRKLGLSGRAELRLLFADWNFNAWE